MKFLLLTLLTLFLFSLPIKTIKANKSIDDKANLICQDHKLEAFPVQAEGRVKPLKVHAEETLKYLTGKTSGKNQSGTQTFCRHSLKSLMPVSEAFNLIVEHKKTKELLEMSPDEKTISLAELNEKISQLEFEYQKTKEENGPYHKDLSKVLSRLSIANDITSGQSWTFYHKAQGWQPLSLYLTPKKLEAFEQKKSQKGLHLIKEFLAQSPQAYNTHVNDDYKLELLYSKLKLFSWAMVTTLLAILAITIFSSPWPGNILIIVSILLELIAIIMRVYISGRAPITNMYETVMFSGFGALVISALIMIFKKEKLYLYAGLAYNFLCLLMINFAHGMLDPSISPLVPVLRDNFWLSTHVTCIILSYAALALSWIIANIILIQNFFSRITHSDYKKKAEIVYNCIKIGSVLLSAGIILGGVWADYSWGRFWGWDPKETWSLIVLLIYMAILHGRYSSWIPKERFIHLCAAAFMSVMMAWFGVNYILASGLHSYGFSEGGAIFLGVFFLVQTLVLLITYKKNVPKN